jgi:hypothetical protein
VESCLWQTKRTKNSTPSSARIKRDVSIGAMLTTKKAVSRLQEKGKYRKKGGVSGILGTSVPRPWRRNTTRAFLNQVSTGSSTR